MNACDRLESWRRAWIGLPSQPVTLEYIIDRFPRWMADIARDLGDRDRSREVIWL